MAHTSSMPEAQTERLSARYFYQPKQEISSLSWWLLGQNLQKKAKSWQAKVLDLLEIICLENNSQNNKAYRPKVPLKIELTEDL